MPDKTNEVGVLSGMPLTDIKVRNAKPGEKVQKLQDGAGLYLEVRPSGAKVWRYRYWRADGKDGIYTIGEYPGVSLAEARKERELARELVKQGRNPTQVRDQARLERFDSAATTFEAVAREWIEENRGHWSKKYCWQAEKYLGDDVFPVIGSFPIREVKAPHLLKIIKAVEGRGAPSIAILIRQWSGQIFRYAINTHRADIDPASSLQGAMRRRQVRHNPPLDAADIPRFYEQLRLHGGYRWTAIAVELLALTFVRTVELRKAEWREIDLDGAEWRVPLERMKMRRLMRPGEVHIVPLSRQAVALLRELHTMTGGRAFLFPNNRRPTDCMCSTTINRVLERMGFSGEFSAHGFRSTASTLLHELGWPDDAIDRQLAHAERKKTRAAYDHATHLPVRRQMMQVWADFLEARRAGPCDITPFRAAG